MIFSGWPSCGRMADVEPHTNGVNGGGESDDEVIIIYYSISWMKIWYLSFKWEILCIGRSIFSRFDANWSYFMFWDNSDPAYDTSEEEVCVLILRRIFWTKLKKIKLCPYFFGIFTYVVRKRNCMLSLMIINWQIIYEQR